MKAPGRVDLDRIERVVHEAMARPAWQRAAFLDATCGDDTALRAEVDSLLDHTDAADRLFESARDDLSLAVLASLPYAAGDPNLGSAIGGYRLVERIGAGGMGNVYRAVRADTEFEQTVAIKLMKRGLDTDELLARFRRERQVLANLNHPNIARLLTGGSTTDGRPYLVMEHVDGRPIDVYCDARQLSIRQRIELFRAVCEAVQFAHRNLVVHRDLKPGNILVEHTGEAPTPKLLDFGIAKVLHGDGSERTRSGTITGERRLTPAYASPEQIRDEPVTTLTDVYSLGVVLYRLLAGRSPYRPADESPEALQRTIRDEPPLRAHELPADLDRILMVALHKQPERRYASVEALSADLGRYLAGFPVTARSDSLTYRMRRFVLRHRVGVATAVGVGLALMIATVFSSVLYARARAATALAERRMQTALTINTYLTDMLTSVEPGVALGRDVTVFREALDRTARRVSDELGDAPVVASMLHRTIGDAYYAIGEYDASAEHLEEADRLQQAHDLAPRDRVLSLLSLGRCRAEQNAFDRAERAYADAMRLITDSAPDDGSIHGLLLARWGDLDMKRGEYESGERRLREAVRLLRRDAVEPQQLADALQNLGLLLVDKRRTDEARPYLREADAVLRGEFGELHPRIATIETGLGWCARRSGDLDQALVHYRRALEIRRTILDPDHYHVANSLIGLAAVLEELGQYEEAERDYLHAIEILNTSVGEHHSETGTAYNNLGGLYRKMRRPAAAIAALGKAAEIYAQVRGPDDYWVSFPQLHLARCHLSLGAHAKALAAIDTALHIRRLNIEETHSDIQSLRTLRGAALSGLGRFEEAETELLQSRELLSAGLDPDAPQVIRATEALVDLYERWGRPEDAASWSRTLPAGR